MTKAETLYRGRIFTIAAISQSGKCPARTFIAGLEASAQKKVLALLERTANHGLPGNDQRFKRLQNCDLYEFKSHRVRLLCFFEGRELIILTHGFEKKQDKTPHGEIERAERLQKEYFAGRK